MLAVEHSIQTKRKLTYRFKGFESLRQDYFMYELLKSLRLEMKNQCIWSKIGTAKLMLLALYFKNL